MRAFACSFEIQPERIMGGDEVAREDVMEVTRKMVAHGMRAQLKTASYITGQLVLSLDFIPGAARGRAAA